MVVAGIDEGNAPPCLIAHNGVEHRIVYRHRWQTGKKVGRARGLGKLALGMLVALCEQ